MGAMLYYVWRLGPDAPTHIFGATPSDEVRGLMLVAHPGIASVGIAQASHAQHLCCPAGFKLIAHALCDDALYSCGFFTHAQAGLFGHDGRKARICLAAPTLLA